MVIIKFKKLKIKIPVTRIAILLKLFLL